LTFTNDSAAAAPQILQNGTGAFTISNSLALTNAIAIGGTGSGGLALSGIISGTGTGLTLNNPNMTLTLSGANTYTNLTEIDAGQLNINSALGNSALNINGGSIDTTTGATITASNFSVNLFSDFVFQGSGTLTLNNTNPSGKIGIRNGDKTITVNAGTLQIRGMKLTDIGGTGGLTKAGAGTLQLNPNFSGNGINNYTGATTINAGTLQEVVGNSTGNNIISASSPLVMGGGILLISGGSNAFGQTFNGTTINPGASTAQGWSHINQFLALAAITRNVGGTINFVTQQTAPLSATNGYSTSTANTAGAILGGWATFDGKDWVTNNGTNIVGLDSGSYTPDAWAAGNDTTVTTGSSPSPDSTTNSLRFATAGANAVILSGTNVITTGGILVTNNAGGSAPVITGGTLEGAAGQDLVVIQTNTSAGLTIGSAIADNTTPPP
jgi:autotransporter-associated beta strand protein